MKPLVKCEAILPISNQPVLSGVKAENIGNGRAVTAQMVEWFPVT